MNNGQLYLAWLRTVAPAVYVSAMRKATGRTRSLGGLTDDLMQAALAPNYRHSFLGDNGDAVTLDPIDVTAISADQPITTDFSFDTSTPTFDTTSIGPLQTVDTGAYATPAPAPNATPAASTSTFANVLTAVAAAGAATIGVVNASNTSKLISLNTTRAQQGLPPVNANGMPVTTTGLATASPSLLALESALTGGGGGSLLPLLLIAGVAAFFLLGGKKSAAV